MIDVALAEVSCGSMLNVSSKCMQPDLGISWAAQNVTNLKTKSTLME